MKNVLIFTNLLTLGILGWFYFNGNISLNKMQVPDCNTCTNICSDYTGKPINKLEVGMLSYIFNNYKNNVGRTPLTTANIANPDASNIWFNLDSLKRFIWNIESNTCGKTCGVNREKLQLGIRIYFARYPKSSIMSSYKDLNSQQLFKFENCHTLFMVPTYDLNLPNSGLQHMDFDPTSTYNKDSCSFPPIKNIDGIINKIPAFMASSTVQNRSLPGSLSTTAQNHGGLCPPLICNPGAAFQ